MELPCAGGWTNPSQLLEAAARQYREEKICLLVASAAMQEGFAALLNDRGVRLVGRRCAPPAEMLPPAFFRTDPIRDGLYPL